MKRAQDLGIRVGAEADLIAVAGNPAVDIKTIRNIKLVIRQGRIWNGHVDSRMSCSPLDRME